MINGDWCSDHCILQQHVVQFFSHLFSAANDNPTALVDGRFIPRLTEVELQSLDFPVRLE